ncbi:MAG TPA: MiaB/RimO family radical SAM methylthiotransferase [Spirochaetota bacterium]|nr:MiaB/RimO family radical SAM methylthiotransferase [Spirochaetota bacterium]HOM37736.1 MiaB/RimO family radical SAM methylthiotransferase [Spirochaetota bacterium]HPQ49694.1 MiaB/RimO family radical SAM methylthiotransferase [Spirochaetota bacterium]
MQKEKIYCLSLGCPKNIVDSEKILAKYFKEYNIVKDPEEATAIFINTCSFIYDAKDESVNAILESIELNKKVFVSGCLIEQHYSEINENIKGINIIKDDILNFEDRVLYFNEYTNYIKVSEGCNRTCSFCTIPSFKGSYRSRYIEDIVKEASFIKKSRPQTKELILVSQDTSYYGIDIYNRPMLPRLLYELSDVGFDWIRVMYLYPQTVSDDLIMAIKNLPNLVKYIDIPLQHLSNSVLKRMNRWGNFEDYYNLINNIRETIPEVSIRSAFIIGYPGESEKEFEELYNGLEKLKLDRVGFFKYSDEDGTVSYSQRPKISKKLKDDRLKIVSELQENISFEVLKKRVGKKLNVIIEEFDGNDYIGRSEYDAPEIDGLVYFKSKKRLNIGNIYPVFIESSDYHDIYGVYAE